MSKERQDAWSEEDDLLLAETVLRHVREGSTQLRAFEEVGDHLDRTSAAVGFRWNAIVRKRYEQALKIAKRQRKERNRALQKTNLGNNDISSQVYNQISEGYKSHALERNSTSNHELQTTNTTNEMENTEHINTPDTGTISQSYSNDSLNMDSIIQFLTQYKENSMQSGVLIKENQRLQEDYNDILRQNRELQNEIADLKEKYENVKDDYQAMLQIMDRARRMILLQEEDALASTKFKMDKNGNLEKIAK